MLFHCYRQGWWKRNNVSSHLPEAVISLRLSVLTFTPPPPPPQTPHRIPRWTIEILAFNISVKHASPPSNALTSKDERWWVHSTNMGHSCRKKSILVWRPCTKKHLGYRYTQIGSDKHKASKELWIVAFLWRRPWKIWGNSANSLPPTGKKHHPVQALDPQKKHKGVHT